MLESPRIHQKDGQEGAVFTKLILQVLGGKGQDTGPAGDFQGMQNSASRLREEGQKPLVPF
jgi:hypothetical protein